MDSTQSHLATLRTQVPGLHDDNQARAAAITRVVGEADSVWVVSRITRACNDKTARSLLPARGLATGDTALFVNGGGFVAGTPDVAGDLALDAAQGAEDNTPKTDALEEMGTQRPIAETQQAVADEEKR